MSQLVKNVFARFFNLTLGLQLIIRFLKLNPLLNLEFTKKADFTNLPQNVNTKTIITDAKPKPQKSVEPKILHVLHIFFTSSPEFCPNFTLK